MIYHGIDYSMTSPAICTFDGIKMAVDYLTKTEKFAGMRSVEGMDLYGYQHKEYNNEIERYNNIASWAMHIIRPESQVYLEDYAMGAKGRVFSIGENTGILKYKLVREKKLGYYLVAPTAVKKFATGKGNADKDKMYEAFYAQTKIDLFSLFGVNSTKSPVSDICDAYFICKMSQENYRVT